MGRLAALAGHDSGGVFSAVYTAFLVRTGQGTRLLAKPAFWPSICWPLTAPFGRGAAVWLIADVFSGGDATGAWLSSDGDLDFQPGRHCSRAKIPDRPADQRRPLGHALDPGPADGPLVLGTAASAWDTRCRWSCWRRGSLRQAWLRHWRRWRECWSSNGCGFWRAAGAAELADDRSYGHSSASMSARRSSTRCG